MRAVKVLRPDGGWVLTPSTHTEIHKRSVEIIRQWLAEQVVENPTVTVEDHLDDPRDPHVRVKGLSTEQKRRTWRPGLAQNL